MTPAYSTRQRGLTLLEVLVVLVVLMFFAVMFMPRMGGNKAKPGRIHCVNNLKNIGLAMRLFANDHGTNFPMDLPVAQGGTRELTDDASRLWQQYLRLTNELSLPKLLWCQTDQERRPATTFSPDPADRRAVVFAGNQHLSYFLGLNAAQTLPQTILAGDRNLTTNGVALGPGRHVLPAGTRLGFTPAMHNNAGNILLADGSVQQVTSGRFTDSFRDALKESGLDTNVWLVP